VAAVSRARTRRVADALLVLMFLAGICAPLIGVRVGAHGWDIGSLADRKKTIEPVLFQSGAAMGATTGAKIKAVAQFPGQFKYYFFDHFGFRNLLVRLHGMLMVNGLHVTSNQSVLLGKDGWLFLANEGSLDDYRHADPFTPAEMESWWKELETRRRWCASRGIAYLVVFAPSKHSIYPEEMPDAYVRLSQPARLPQLVAYLNEHHSPVDVLDLTQPLIEARHAGTRLYHKTDTHWNDRGAWMGYLAIMAAVREKVPGVRTLAMSDLEPVTTLRPGMDLAGLLGLSDCDQEQSLDLKPRIPLRLPYVEQDVVEPFTVNENAPDQPRVVVFRDSFMTALLPWLAESFGRGAYLWEYGFDTKLIDAEHPAIVIQEIAERKLSIPLDELRADRPKVRLVNGKWELDRWNR
jgi:hypothetical protein